MNPPASMYPMPGRMLQSPRRPTGFSNYTPISPQIQKREGGTVRVVFLSDG